jgi:uncharacterized protein (TIGR02246 family)
VATGPSSADLQAIKRLREAFITAYNKRDVDGLVQLFTEDAVFIPADDATCEGRNEIADYLGDIMDEMPATLEFDVQETQVQGSWAFERIDVTLTVNEVASGEEGEIWARYLWVLRRRPGGSWQIARIIYNIDESGDEDEGEDEGAQPKT